jgi:hypothetical protein
MSIRPFAHLAMMVGLALGASCADEPAASPPPESTRTACTPSTAELDRLDRTLATCTTDAACPCGSRCAPVGVCTYDCRDDDDCVGATCDAAGRCVAEVAP